VRQVDNSLLKTYLNLSKLRKPASFANWLYHIAEGTALDAARRKKRELPLFAAQKLAPAPRREEGAGESDLARQVRNALATLTEPSRLAVILHYVNGYSHAEVADFLGVSPGAVKTRLCRARGRLRREMVGMVERRLKEERPFFRFTARDGRGQLVEGTSIAESEQELVRRLGEHGYFVQKVARMGSRESARAKRAALQARQEAMVRVTTVILEQAFNHKATRIRIALHPPRKPRQVRVLYTIGAKEHDVMTLPLYVWPPLREELARRAGLEPRPQAKRQTGQMTFRFERKRHDLGLVFTPTRISIEPAPPP
jgi:RNA polymerase sigma-70 factor (ECF subfamily)